MKRAIQVVHYATFAGPTNQALRLVEPLSELGWNLSVVLPDEIGSAHEVLAQGGVDVVRMPLHRMRATWHLGIHAGFAWSLLPEVTGLRRLFRRLQPHVVVLCGLINPHAAFAAHLESIPVVWQIVDTRTPPALRGVSMTLVRGLASTVMFAGAQLQIVHDAGKRLRVPTFVYYPPISTQTFRPSNERRRKTREELGLPLSAPVFGLVGNINPQKGIEYFIRAAALIICLLPKARFVVVGQFLHNRNGYTAQLYAEMRTLGLRTDQVIFTGGRLDMENLYPAMDALLSTSVPRSEGITTVALEAMACGIPVVATDVGAIREIVEEGVTGLVVEPESPEAIATAAYRVVTDSRLANLGSIGRKTAVARHDSLTCANTHVAAFEAAILTSDARGTAAVNR